MRNLRAMALSTSWNKHLEGIKGRCIGTGCLHRGGMVFNRRGLHLWLEDRDSSCYHLSAMIFLGRDFTEVMYSKWIPVLL